MRAGKKSKASGSTGLQLTEYKTGNYEPTLIQMNKQITSLTRYEMFTKLQSTCPQTEKA